MSFMLNIGAFPLPYEIIRGRKVLLTVSSGFLLTFVVPLCWFYLPWKVHANIPPKAYGWQVVWTRYIGLHSLATFYLQMCPIAPLQFGVTTWFLLVVWPHFRLYQRAKHAAISLPRPKPFGWVNHAKSPSYSFISLCLVARSLVLAGKYPMFHRSTIAGGS